jgi:hypothetical protein
MARGNPSPSTGEAMLQNLLRRVKRGAGFEVAMKCLVDVADLDVELQIAEEPRGSNRGALLAKYFEADNYKPPGKDEGYAWCAAAVSYWVQVWLGGCDEAKHLFAKVQAPCTAGAFALQAWAEAQRGAMEVIPGGLLRSRTAQVQPGDIVIHSFSHCGIAKTRANGGLFTCIEGNTDARGSREGWQVARKVRGYSSVRALLRFIPKGVPV